MLAYLTWRELLIAIVALLIIYVFFLFLQLNRLKKEKTRVYEWARQFVPSELPGDRESIRRPMADTSSPGANRGTEQTVPTTTGIVRMPNEVPDAVATVHKFKMIGQEIAQLRAEVERLKTQMRALQEATHRESENLNQSSIQSISPYYIEAMRMAAQGKDAGSISLSCGISRAEADLVISMANKNKPLSS